MTDQQILGWLRGDTPNVRGKEFPIRQHEIVLGRGTQSDIQLTDPKISRRHARLRIAADRVLLEDLGSAHGTLVNGERREVFFLKDGDVIAMGDTLLVFKPSADMTATIMDSVADAPVRTPADLDAAPAPPIERPAQPAPADSGKPRIKWFLMGLIPVLLLGAGAITLLFVLGGETEPYVEPEYRSVQNAVSPTAGVAGPTETVIESAAQTGMPFEPSETPELGPASLTVRPRGPAEADAIVDLSEVSIFNESESSGELAVFDASMRTGDNLGIDYMQCASDEATLQENLAVTMVDFVLYDLIINLDDLARVKFEREDRFCYQYRGLVSGLNTGTHEILNRYEQVETIFDGFESYPPESFNSLYRVEVLAPEVDEGGAANLEPEGRRVTLHTGDARTFSVPPEAIAYANIEHSTPPAEITVVENCGATCWRYNEWLALKDPGQFIEVESAMDTTAIGVQLWGDDNDGWARVIVDGEEVWSGEMRGSDNQWPGGAFVRYLEVAGLEPGNHMLRFEPIGQGGAVTAYFFGVGEVTP